MSSDSEDCTAVDRLFHIWAAVELNTVTNPNPVRNPNLVAVNTAVLDLAKL